MSEDPLICACGCGETVTDRPKNARYATDACRTRAWKARTGYTDQRRRKPSRNASRRRVEVRLSYRKTHNVLVAEFRRVNMADPERRARTVLDQLLTDRQREALRG